MRNGVRGRGTSDETHWGLASKGFFCLRIQPEELIVCCHMLALDIERSKEDCSRLYSDQLCGKIYRAAAHGSLCVGQEC